MWLQENVTALGKKARRDFHTTRPLHYPYQWPITSHLFQKPEWDYDNNPSSTPDPLLLGHHLVDPTQSPSKLLAAASKNPEP